jgi:hypothetical protein
MVPNGTVGPIANYTAVTTHHGVTYGTIGATSTENPTTNIPHCGTSTTTGAVAIAKTPASPTVSEQLELPHSLAYAVIPSRRCTTCQVT